MPVPIGDVPGEFQGTRHDLHRGGEGRRIQRRPGDDVQGNRAARPIPHFPLGQERAGPGAARFAGAQTPHVVVERQTGGCPLTRPTADRQDHPVGHEAEGEERCDRILKQVGLVVNASGKKANSTLTRPRNEDSVTSSPAVDGKVKSGAGAPIRGPAPVAAVMEGSLGRKDELDQPEHQRGHDEPGDDHVAHGLQWLLGRALIPREGVELQQPRDHEHA